jgi:hypothetical protein
MNVYSIDFPIHATAYIKAGSQAEAIEIAKRSLAGQFINVVDDAGDVEFSDLPMTDPSLPEVSLSPAMTICQPEEFDDAFIECVEGEDA